MTDQNTIKVCKTCGVEMSKKDKHKNCSECRVRKRKRQTQILLIGIGGFSIGFGLGCLFNNVKLECEDCSDEEEVKHPLLPIDIAMTLYDLWGDSEETIESIQIIEEQIEDGSITVEDIRACLKRPDIDDEQWRDFEDGWRPDGW